MSPPEDIPQRLAREMEGLRQRHAYRERRMVTVLDSTHVEIGGRRYVNFASNNYLGLTHHPKVIAAASEVMRDSGAGSGAAPLVTGYTKAHAAAEQTIARWKGTEDAVLLPTGYQANHAAIQAIVAAGEVAGRGVRFLLDKLAHASLIDAVRSVGLPFRVFPHNGISKLRRLLEESEPGPLQVVMTESIFSMDGDAVELSSLDELKREHPFVLLLDEAHGSGVYGPEGAGYAAELGLRDSVDLSIVTLSKALGGIGGAVCGAKPWCDAVVNFGRSYIYSTSPPPSAADGAVAAIEVLRDEPQRQARVRLLAVQVREDLKRMGYEIPAGDAPVIPVIFGGEEATLRASAVLRDKGLLITAIRPPSVARGGSRLRVTLSCDHSDAEIRQLLEELRPLVQSPV